MNKLKWLLPLLFLTLPGIAQDAKQPKDDPKVDKKGQVAPITSKLVAYTPKTGDVLSYETNMDEKGKYLKQTYKQNRIVVNVDKNETVTVLIKDVDGRLYHTKWSPKENFLDSFPTFRKEYSSYEVGKWSIPMVTLSGEDGITASFALRGTKLIFPSELFLARNGQTLVRLVKITRQAETAPQKKTVPPKKKK